MCIVYSYSYLIESCSDGSVAWWYSPLCLSALWNMVPQLIHLLHSSDFVSALPCNFWVPAAVFSDCDHLNCYFWLCYKFSSAISILYCTFCVVSFCYQIFTALATHILVAYFCALSLCFPFVSFILFLSWIIWCCHMRLLTVVEVAHWYCCELLLISLRVKRKKEVQWKEKDYDKKKASERYCFSLYWIWEHYLFQQNTSYLAQFTKCLLLCSISCAYALDSTCFESLFDFRFVILF